MSNASVNDEDAENEATYLVLDALPEKLRHERLETLEALEGPARHAFETASARSRAATEALEAAQREADDAMRELGLTQSLYDGIRRAARRFVRDELNNSAPSIEQLLLLCLVERRPELHHLLDFLNPDAVVHFLYVSCRGHETLPESLQNCIHGTCHVRAKLPGVVQ